MYVAIEGCIASGKSTTAALLAQNLGFAHVKEQTSLHPFIAQFYTDPARFAIETELAFVLIHYHQLHPLAGADIVSDFSPAKDKLFAEMNLSGSDLDIFMYVYRGLLERVPQPDIAVFLDLPIEECLRRSVARGRAFEAGLKLEYLAKLRAAYLRSLDELATDVHLLEVHPRESQDQVAEAVRGLIPGS